jgi:hypothetical protein
MARPNYLFWDRQDTYSPWDLSFLCLDEEPGPRGRSYPSRQHAAVVVAILQDIKDKAVSKFPDYQFRRSDLRDWAERTGRRFAMPFLFPEDREAPQDTPEAQPPQQGEYTEKEEPMLLRLLDAVLRLRFGDACIDRLSKPGKKHPDGEFDRIYREVASKMEIDSGTLRQYLKRLPH